MMTSCLRCRVVRLRVIAKSFLAFGKTPEQVMNMLAQRNPDLQFWFYHSVPSEQPHMSLNVTKEGWHFQIARIPG